MPEVARFKVAIKATPEQLQEEVRQLRFRLRQVEQRRDEWKRRAERAEAEPRTSLLPVVRELRATIGKLTKMLQRRGRPLNGCRPGMPMCMGEAALGRCTCETTGAAFDRLEYELSSAQSQAEYWKREAQKTGVR